MGRALKQQTGALIFLDRNRPWTTSTTIARECSRPHKNVLRELDALIEIGTINGLNFEPIEYTDKRGRLKRALKLDERGFLVAMPFVCGRKAHAGQARLVDEFLRARKELERLSVQRASADWQEARHAGINVRKDEVDVIDAFVKYAASQGSKHCARYFVNLTTLVNRELFGSAKPGARDLLDKDQLEDLAAAERIVRRTLTACMSEGAEYHTAYARVRERVQQFAGLIGRFLPPSSIQSIMQ